MSSRFKPAEFLALADLLLHEIEPLPDGEKADPYDIKWNGCEAARARSAVSRSYYAAFLTLKDRLIGARVEWRRDESRFPSRDVHSSMKTAIWKHAEGSSKLYTLFIHLLLRRKDADYELRNPVEVSTAESLLDDGRELVRLADALSQQDIEEIAWELHVAAKA